MDLKDHFEHLRTVHFLLMATCLALLVVSEAPQNRALKLADKQLNLLETIISQWTEIDFASAIDHQVQLRSIKLPAFKVLIFPDSLFVPTKGAYGVDFVSQAWFPISSKECKEWLYDPIAKRKPQTLSDIHQLWDCLQSANTMVIPLAFSADSAALNGKRVPLIESATSTSRAGSLHLLFRQTDEDTRTEIQKALGLSVDYAFVSILYAKTGASERLIVPVEKQQKITVDLVEPLRSLNSEFTIYRGLYSRAFPELNEATAGYEDLTFDKLRAIMAAQRRCSDQTFEVFSVKFPSDAVARWGLALLLGIQLYLLVNMSSVQLTPNTEIPVAWIALYQNRLAQTIFVFTVTIFPLLTSGKIGYAGIITGRKSFDFWAVLIAMPLSVLLAWLTLASFGRRFPGPLPDMIRRMWFMG